MNGSHCLAPIASFPSLLFGMSFRPELMASLDENAAAKVAQLAMARHLA